MRRVPSLAQTNPLPGQGVASTSSGKTQCILDIRRPSKQNRGAKTAPESTTSKIAACGTRTMQEPAERDALRGGSALPNPAPAFLAGHSPEQIEKGAHAL